LSNHEVQQLIELIDSFENSATISNKSNVYQMNQEAEQVHSQEVADEGEEDLFRSYMQQKELEYQKSKHLCNLDVSSIRKVAKSSSGNSSLNSSSTSTFNNDHEVDHEILDQENRNRRVTFESPIKPKISKSRDR